MSQWRVRWEVVSSRLMWSVVSVEFGVWRGFWGSARGYVNEQGLVDSLAVGIIRVNDLAYRLVRL